MGKFRNFIYVFESIYYWEKGKFGFESYKKVLSGKGKSTIIKRVQQICKNIAYLFHLLFVSPVID